MRSKNLLYRRILVMVVLTWTTSCKQAVTENQSDQTDSDLEIIDVSQKQLSLYNQHLTTDSAERAKIFRDSLFYPYKEIWDGLIGGREDIFDQLVNHYGLRTIDALNEKNKLFFSEGNDKALLESFYRVRDGMIQLTGHSPKGKWFLIYGPSWANLGGVGGGIMFIDFAFPENVNLNSVINWFPHELNHQIYSHTTQDTTRNVLWRSIDEGFATYVNKVYWKEIEGQEDYSLAMSLSYSDEELRAANENWDFILSSFKELHLSTDNEDVSKFGAANQRLREDLPGKIGYLIGYRIVESYVKIHGKDSWKDIYTLSHSELLSKSRFFEQ